MTSMRLVGMATVAMVVGFLAGEIHGSRAAAQAPAAAAKAAYLVVSSKAIAPEKMGPYRAAAGPLARAAGLEMVARGNPRMHVFEGQWALDGDLTIEKYRSMDDLLKFWNSPAYQDAKKLREGLAKIDFIVAIDGQ